MSEFAKQPHPDAAHRERLSREIPGLSPRQVQVWFQNRYVYFFFFPCAINTHRASACMALEGKKEGPVTELTMSGGLLR